MSEVLSKATPGLFRQTSGSTFFTMLAFSQILNIYLQWLAALGLAIVFVVTLKKPTHGSSSGQYNHDMGPRCCLIIPDGLSIMASFDCQSLERHRLRPRAPLRGPQVGPALLAGCFTCSLMLRCRESDGECEADAVPGIGVHIVN